jgi:DNA-binding CsgD family transcriptional regulator
VSISRNSFATTARPGSGPLSDRELQVLSLVARAMSNRQIAAQLAITVAAPDTDRAQAVRSRRQLLAELQDPDTIGFGVHFADVVFGQVRGYGPAWRPEP